VRHLSVVALCVGITASAFADGAYKKSYFGKTPVGSFAKYKSTCVPCGNSVESVRRLTDDEGQARFKYDSQYTTGKWKGTKSSTTYTLDKDYPLDREGLDFIRYAVGATLDNNGQPMKLDPETVKAMRTNMTEYGSKLVFEASESINGHPSDRYSYKIESETMPESGKIWLSDSVPFGVVRWTRSSKDATGTVNKIDQVLTESGIEKPPADKPAARSKKKKH
jgi:hypothetical protein